MAPDRPAATGGRAALDALFLPAANRRLTFRAPCPMVGTVHDMASSHLHNKYDRLRSVYNRRLVPGLIRRLARVITVSECSKRDIVTHAGVAPERITVIPNGVDHGRFRPGDRAAAASRVAQRHGLDRPYLLYVARLEHPGKNHVRLVRALDRLKQRTGLPHLSAPLFADHFPRRPVFAGSLLVQMSLEIAVTLATELDPPASSRWKAQSVVGMKLREFIPPGKGLDLEARLKQRTDESAILTQGVRAGEEVVASARLLLAPEVRA